MLFSVMSQKLSRMHTCECCEVKAPMVYFVMVVVPLRMDAR
jgi:hypothetical protein